MNRKTAFWVGFILLVSYWLFLRPVGFQRGYVEDFCTFETTRQIMADQIREHGAPRFETQHYLYPQGTQTVYMPQSIEQTWIGAYFWNWNKDFPYVWVYSGVSFLITYLGVGFLLGKMGLSRMARWSLATLVSLVHIPRHYVIWYHSEHIFMHWIYLSFFLDAWIWQRFYRENKFSLSLEVWRGFLMVGVFGTAGYFWGPSVVEWILVRACLLGGFVLRMKLNGSLFKKTPHQNPNPSSSPNPSLSSSPNPSLSSSSNPSLSSSPSLDRSPVIIEKNLKSALLPGGLILLWLAIELQWFIPLFLASKKLGTVPQGLGYHAPIFMVIRPLWWDWVMFEVEKWIPYFKGLWLPFQFPETKVTIGWIFWIPAVIAINRLRKKAKGPGVQAILPFIILLGIAIWYLGIKPHWIQFFLQATIPFMKFFRAASRWGLFLPIVVGVIIALSWPELSRWFVQQWKSGSKKFRWAFGVFVILSGAESTWLLQPPEMMAPLSGSMVQFLTDLKSAPGSAVLDLPFCTIGGNSVCLHQCPNYPYSTAGACFRQWHEKDVYGIYESRLVPSQCDSYDQLPYSSWNRTFWDNQCFDDEQWKTFCTYLDQHPEFSAVLIYPDLWKASGTPECLQQIEFHLGKRLGEGVFSARGNRGGKEEAPTRVWRYSAKCIQ